MLCRITFYLIENLGPNSLIGLGFFMFRFVEKYLFDYGGNVKQT